MDNKKIQPPFVGESRGLLVDGLLTILDTINQSGKPRWISLEAPSGWGKTRVAQELYARLAARQTQGYWPATILESTDADRLDIGSCRKRIYPQPEYFDRTSGSLPEFMWWGLACDLRNGLPSQTLKEDLGQLDAHTLYLEAAWSALAAVHEKSIPTLEQARKMLTEIIDEVSQEGIGAALESIANSSIPLLGLAVNLGKWGVGKARHTRKVKKTVEVAGMLGSAEHKEDLLEDTVAMLSKMARPGLPLVVFVEDLHKATPLMEELVERILRTNAAILLLTTTWPGELERSERLPALLTDDILRPRILRVQHDQHPPKAFPEGASLGELPDQALRELILAYYPNTDTDTLSRLAERYNNPLPLELVCTLPKYLKRFGEKGDLKLPKEEIDRLPSKVEDLYRELWNTLPEPVQQALALATLAIPEHTAAWYNPVTQRAIAQCQHMEQSVSIASALDQDQIPHGWTRSFEKWLRGFNEPDQLRIAHGYVDDHYFQEDIDQYLDQLASELNNEKLETDSVGARHCAWLRIALHRKGKTSGEDALEAIRLLQDVLEDSPRELPTCIELGRYLDALEVDGDSTQMLDARGSYLYALAESGDLDAALKMADGLLNDMVRVMGADHPDTLTVRYNVAARLAESGQVVEALSQFEVLLQDLNRTLGPDHPYTLTTRGNIAVWLAESGQLDEALSRFEALLQDQHRILGPDHPGTLKAQSNIAFLFAKFGQVAEALSRLEAVLQDKHRILGPDHPDALTTRGYIASLLAESGQLDKALSRLEAVLQDQHRVLGSDHPDTLKTRGNIASLLAGSGQLVEALSRCEALLQDQHRILGSDHPDTLTTRGNIAVWLAGSGQIVEALSQCEALLQDQHRILGPDHPYTLTIRNNVASLLAQSGQVAEALSRLEAVLQDRHRILGPDHPDTLTIRNNIAFWLAESGQIAEALSQFEALLQDQTRILGSDHPDTLRTRSNLELWQNQLEN